MTVTGPILRFAGTTLLVIAVTGCGGIDRANRGTGAASDAEPAAASSDESLESLLDLDAAADEELSSELDAWLADSELNTLAAAADEEGSAPGSAGSSAPSGGVPTSPTPSPLPPFDAGSLADLDAALSTLDDALGAGEPGSEGNLP